MSDIEHHDFEWNDRLQDLIDADVVGSARAATEAHIATCKRCRSQFTKLKKLDALLQSRVERPGPGASFDQQVFARINAFDAQARETARRRADRELKDNLERLSNDWRRRLFGVAGGATAGAALAVALIGWMNQSGLANALVGAASNSIGSGHTSTLHTFVMLAIGATVGAVVSRWVTSTVE
jgi:anti-sigma factor RsiW